MLDYIKKIKEKDDQNRYDKKEIIEESRLEKISKEKNYSAKIFCKPLHIWISDISTNNEWSKKNHIKKSLLEQNKIWKVSRKKANV